MKIGLSIDRGAARLGLRAPHRRDIRVFAGVFAALLLGCASLERDSGGLSDVIRSDADRAPCVPHFPLDQGWLGGDGVYSVPLASLAKEPVREAVGERTTLWLFGDSFVDATLLEGRRSAAFVHNSVARSRCRADGRFEVEYVWGVGADGDARAIFDTGRVDEYWWPLGGFVFEDALYVGLLLVAPGNDDATPFEPIGVDLGRVSNPSEDPSEWRLTVVPLSRGRDGFPAGAMLVEGGHVFFFGFARIGAHGHPRFLSRVSFDAVRRFDAGLAEEIETWGTDGRWHAGLEPAKARLLMEDDATEMSVAREPGGGLLRAVYSFPYQGGSGLDGAASEVVYTRTAERPEGPWSAPQALFVIPDLREDSLGGYDPTKRCYSAKAHPAFGTQNRMVVTYVCNLMAVAGANGLEVMQRLLESPELYRPKVVSWPRPARP